MNIMNTKITLYFNGKLTSTDVLKSYDNGTRYDSMHERLIEDYCAPHTVTTVDHNYLRNKVSFVVPFSIDDLRNKIIKDYKNRSYWPSLNSEGRWIKISNFTKEFKEWCKETFKDADIKMTDMEVMLDKTFHKASKNPEVEYVQYCFGFSDQKLTKEEQIKKREAYEKLEKNGEEILKNIIIDNFNF